MINYETIENRPWNSYINSITSIKINDGITSIGKNSFTNMISVENITIGQDVITIGDEAIEGMISLININVDILLGTAEAEVPIFFNIFSYFSA